MRPSKSEIFCIVILVLFNTDFIYSNEVNHVGLSEINRDITSSEDSPQNGTYGVVKRSQRSPVNALADIARFVDKSPIGKAYSVYTDDTMTMLIFRVVALNANPSIHVTMPSGNILLNRNATIQTNTNGTNIATFDIPLTNSTHYGNWSFTRNDYNTWDVTVQGESPVYIKHEFFEIGSNKPVDDKYRKGRVVKVSNTLRLKSADKQYRLLVTVKGLMHVKRVETGRMFSKSREFLRKMVSLTSIGNNMYDAANTSVLSETFYVGIQGKDKFNHTFQRIDPTEVKPILFRIDVSPNTGAFVLVNSTVNITYVITSYIKTSAKVSINNTMGLVQGSNPISSNPKAGENVTGTFTLEAGAIEGTMTVKIMIKYLQSRAYIDGPKVQRTYTIVSNETLMNSASRNKKTQLADHEVPITAIAGGVGGAIIILIAVVIAAIVYRKLAAKKNTVDHGENKDMPRKTAYSTRLD